MEETITLSRTAYLALKEKEKELEAMWSVASQIRYPLDLEQCSVAGCNAYVIHDGQRQIEEFVNCTSIESCHANQENSGKDCELSFCNHHAVSFAIGPDDPKNDPICINCIDRYVAFQDKRLAERQTLLTLVPN